MERQLGTGNPVKGYIGGEKREPDDEVNAVPVIARSKLPGR
jgi:hypothetical protein